MLDCDEYSVEVQQVIPSGHKIALLRVAAGEPVRRYGQVIGFATADTSQDSTSTSTTSG